MSHDARSAAEYMLELSIPHVMYVRIERIPRWLSFAVTTAVSVVSTWLAYR